MNEPAMHEVLIAKLGERSATVGIIGQGYVGLSVGLAAATAGLDVIGIDLDTDLITGLHDGRLAVPGVRDDAFEAGIATGRMTFDTDAARIAVADVILICVPTPVHEHRPDLTAVESAGTAISRHLSPGTLVILESTTYPGTTERVLAPRLEAGGLTAGTDFMLAYSPERIDPGNDKFGFTDVPRVVGGMDPASTQAATAFYDLLVDVVHPVSSCRAAEMAKLLENTYRMVNIALVNELAMVCHDQGLSPWEVIDAAASKPFGFAKFVPGPGVGGHCIPIDPTYLTWQSRRDTGRPYRLVELANDINAEMPAYVTSRIADELNELGRSLKGSRILALGVTYKPDVGDVRESAAIHVMTRLARKGALVSFHDPFIDTVEDDGQRWQRTDLTAQTLAEADIVMLLTPHATYDLDWVADHAHHVFDARNAFDGPRDNVTIL
ncbi:nucleotide sugar dehydrogenase [soil metagenome]